MKYGSMRDCLSYGWWGECFHPKYHCGPPDGIRDHMSVKHAAVSAANRAMSDQNGGGISRDFKFGYQQAYIDVSNGGSGALPAIPPPRYWAAPYRTTWGHNKAREWFAGYQAGASSAQCCMPRDTLSVPTSVYRGCDNRLTVGLDGGSFGAAPIVNTNYGGAAPYATNPPMSSPYSMTPYSAGPYSMYPYAGAMNAPMMNGPMQFGVPGHSGAAPPMMNAPAMTNPYSESLPGGGWSSGPSPAPPNYPAPNYSTPNITPPAPAGGGHSIPLPNSESVNPTSPPMSGQQFAPQRGYSASNPWGRFSGTSGFGFKPEGVLR